MLFYNGWLNKNLIWQAKKVLAMAKNSTFYKRIKIKTLRSQENHNTGQGKVNFPTHRAMYSPDS